MRSISRVADVSINTVAKLLVDAGKACAAFHDEKVRGVKARRVQVDEVWTFTAAKATERPEHEAASRRTPAIRGPGPQSRPIPSFSFRGWSVAGTATTPSPSWTICGTGSLTAFNSPATAIRAYLEAVEGAFGADVDYAQLVKLFGAAPESMKGRYSPAECIGIRKERIEGSPDPTHVSTSFAERQNLTMRMQMRRFTRLTNAFSKKFENHMHMVALYTVWYNYVKQHKSLKGFRPRWPLVLAIRFGA